MSRLDCVKKFADNVIEYGMDKYRENPTSLFADGMDTLTKEHIQWRFKGGREVVISNLNDQQNLFRALKLLSELTLDNKYTDAAKSAIKYHFDNLQDKSGLLQMGGHWFIDLKTLEGDGPSDKGGVHELKNSFPYYELMFEVDKEKTAKYIKAVWNAHVYNWKTLEISRHGKYGLEVGDIWKNEYEEYKEPFFQTSGLSFMNAGNDMIYAAAMLYYYTKDEGALLWCKRLAKQYVKARNPKTGLGGYQFTQPLKKAETDDDRDTNSKYGDRAKRQFREFGDIALEGNLVAHGQASTIYYKNVLIELYISELLGDDDFKQWCTSGLKSYIKYAYDFESNECIPMFSDGTDLTDYEFQRDGYYGKKGNCYRRENASSRFMLSGIRAYKSTKDEYFWEFARNVAIHNDLGDIGRPNTQPKLNYETKNTEAVAIFALTDIYSITKNRDYLKLAEVIADNIIKERYRDGYFYEYPNSNKCKFDTIDPFAILTLEAALIDKLDKAPKFVHGESFIQGGYEDENGVEIRMSSTRLYM